MSLILNIDTAIDKASVCLSKDGDVLQISYSENQKDHASWLHTAITGLLKKNNYKINELQAVAVSIGPGSYTGLRVGLSAAKGFCFALHIPLITISSLKLIAFAAKDEATDLICPLIDARRMEVFTALYDKNLQEKNSAHTLVLDEKSFASILLTNKVLFCGNGIAKLKPIIAGHNANYCKINSDASHLAYLSLKYYINKDFADLAYTEPLYIKEFYKGR